MGQLLDIVTMATLFGIFSQCLAVSVSDMPMCDRSHANECLVLERSPLSWRDALESCQYRRGRLLDLSVSPPEGAQINTYLQEVVPDAWGRVWTSGRSEEKKWHWISGDSYLRDQGCYEKDILSTDTVVQTSKELNPEKCWNLCREKGIRIAAIYFNDTETVQCVCSRTFHYTQPSTGCDIRCPVQPRLDTLFCGDQVRMLVYDTAGTDTEHWVQQTQRDQFMCAVMEHRFGFKWMEKPCHSKQAYLCQFKVASCDECASLSSLHVCISGSCIVDYDSSSTWWEADQQCRKVGAKLVTISSSNIQSELVTYLRTWGAVRYPQKNFWIGLTRWKWRWIQPEKEYTLTKLGPYVNWMENKPEETFTKQCLALNTNSMGWENIGCGEKLQSVCVVNYTAPRQAHMPPPRAGRDEEIPGNNKTSIWGIISGILLAVTVLCMCVAFIFCNSKYGRGENDNKFMLTSVKKSTENGTGNRTGNGAGNGTGTGTGNGNETGSVAVDNYDILMKSVPSPGPSALDFNNPNYWDPDLHMYGDIELATASLESVS